MVEGLSHITFIVSDLDRMEEMLTKVRNRFVRPMVSGCCVICDSGLQ